ncbi:MAG TPA: hypothetical protein VFR87_07130 [Nocardioidaceae bacterium]|nr:hypothetical protein [Nocardioidaceae bacterium]
MLIQQDPAFSPPELNRDTEKNSRAAGLVLKEVDSRGIWRAIVASPGS